MQVTHEPWLVALSLIVAIQGAFVGLSLAVQVGGSTGLRRRLLLAGAAFSLAVAIWSMHFVGMSALHASAHLHHAVFFVIASIVIAIAASGLALSLAGGRGGRPPLLLSAIALGAAISGMHYTAMAGLTVHSAGPPQISAPALSSDLLAIVVAIVAFLVSGIFLLTLIPERSMGNDTAPALPSSGRDRAALTASPAATWTLPRTAELGRGSNGPLCGAGGSPRRFAQQLPVQRDGVTHYVAVETVVAVHANAHYTYIFDGTAKLFCPLPISDVEARLDTSRFLRVHRSHIVNIERVRRLKRAGDSGMVELEAADAYVVPVSRSRVSWLKSRIGARPSEIVPQST